MYIYKLVKVSKLGEPHPEYGSTFWCDVAEVLTPIKFSSHSEFRVGDTITAESATEKRPEKPYLQLTKVKKAEVMPDPPFEEKPSEAPQSVSQGKMDLGERLDEIQLQLTELNEKLDRLLGETYAQES